MKETGSSGPGTKKTMNDIIVDSNIFINVWNREIDPKTGEKLWEPSSRILAAAGTGAVRGHICLVNAIELVHHARLFAGRKGLDPEQTMRDALRRISENRFELLIPEPYMLSRSLSLVLSHHLDPYDSILLATAIGAKMDAIISRDKKLTAKASDLIPVLSPETFLAKTSL